MNKFEHISLIQNKIEECHTNEDLLKKVSKIK